MKTFLLAVSILSLLLVPTLYGLEIEEGQEHEQSQEHGSEEMMMDMERGELQLQNRRIEAEMRGHEMEMKLEKYKAELEHKGEMRRLELEQQRVDLERGQRGRHHNKGSFLHLIFIISVIVRILAAIWVYQDIKARKTGSGLWIAITLLAGLIGALVYAVVRLEEKPKATTKAE